MEKYFEKISFVLLAWMFIHTSTHVGAQVNLYNQGVKLSIRQGTNMSIQGSYYDTGTSADATFFVAGQLYVSGNIYNNSTGGSNKLLNSFYEGESFVGRVIFTGASSSINRNNGNNECFFPNLTLELPPDGTLQLNIGITVGDELRMASGKLNLNGHNIALENNAKIAAGTETELNRIYGSSGAITTDMIQINTNPNAPEIDHANLGFIYSKTSNLSDTYISREHGAAGLDNFAFTDGKRVLRLYRLNTTQVEGKMDVSIRYLEVELDGLNDENALALYISNDNGSTWRKDSTSSVDSGSNRVTANAVTFTNNGGNLIALSIADCLIQRPSIPITTNAIFQDNTYNICELQDLTLSVPAHTRNKWTLHLNAEEQMVNATGVSDVNRFSHSGNYQAWARNARGCENTNQINVTVRSVPQANFSITPSPGGSICHGTPLQFQDLSTNADGVSFTRLFTFDDPNTVSSTQADPTIIYQDHGPKFPTLVVTSEHGCVSNTAVSDLPLLIQSLPVPVFTMQSGGVDVPDSGICEDIQVDFPNSSTYTPISDVYQSSLTYTWNFGDGSEKLIRNNDPYDEIPLEVSHIFQTHGNYIVTLRAMADVTGCFAEATHNITVNPEPIPDFEIIENALSVNHSCPGIYLTFENNSSIPDGTPITYSWNFQDGTSSTQISPVKQYVQHASYDVVLTATSTAHGCVESLTKNLVINPQPTGVLSVLDADVCPGEDAEFSHNSAVAFGTLTYEWDFDDGTDSTEPAPIVHHSYSEPRQYNVTLTRTADMGCINTVQRAVRVRPNPVPEFIHQNKCDGETIEFANISAIQSGTIVSYHWDFDDNAMTSNIASPSHLFSHPEIFNVSLSATSDFGCQGTIVKPVTVFQNPGFNLGSHLVVCENQFTIDPLLAGQSFIPDNSVFEWRNNDDTVLGNNLQLQITSSGVYGLTITTPPGDGACESTIQVPVYLFSPVTLGDDRTVCEHEILDAGTSDPEISYEWSFNLENSNERTFFADETGLYAVSVTHTVAGMSCVSQDEVVITIDDPIDLSLPQEITACEDALALLSSPVVANSHEWYRIEGPVRTLIGNQSDIQVSDPGIYALNLSNAACSAEAFTEVVHIPLPHVNFSVSDVSICPNEIISIEDYSTNGLTMSSWAFGDGTTSFYATTIEKQYEVPGTYTVLLTGEDEHNCAQTFEVEVTVHATPVVDFTLENTCANGLVPVNNNSSGGVTFAWEFGDGTGSNEFLPNKVYAEEGAYEVSLTVSSSECAASSSRNVVIHPLPVIDFGDQVTTCGNSLELNAANVGSTYRWFDVDSDLTLSTNQNFLMNQDGDVGVEITTAFGCLVEDVASVVLGVPLVANLGQDRQVCDEEQLSPGYFPGATLTWTIPGSDGDVYGESISASTSGLYSVAIVDQNGCLGNSAVTLEVNETPAIPLDEAYVRCDNQTLQLIAGSDPAFLYEWSTGESNSSILVETSASISVVVTNENCVAEKAFTVLFNPTPVVDFSVANICSSESAAFVNQSTVEEGQLSFVWNFGDGSWSASSDPTKSYGTSGNFQVSLTATSEEGCVSSAQKKLSVYDAPVANFNITGLCSNQDLIVDNVSSFDGMGDLNYQWNFGNGLVSQDATPAVLYSEAGNYLASLTVLSPDGCTDTKVQNVQIVAGPSVEFWENEISSCNESVMLNAGNAGSTYLWSDQSTAQSLVVNNSGTYSVVISAPNGCTIEESTNVTFDYSFQSQLPDALEGCGEVELDPNVQASTYLWSTGANTPSILAKEDGEYFIQIISSNLCIGKDTVSVDIHPIPVVDLGDTREVCDGDIVTLSADTSVPATRTWSTAETTSFIVTRESGNYSVELISDKGCVFQDSVEVVFNPLPEIGFNDEITVCGNIVLDAGNTGSKYVWSTGSLDKTISVTESGWYYVDVTSSKNCVSNDQIFVTVNPVPNPDLGPDVILCPQEVKVFDAGGSGDNYNWSDGSTNRFLEVGSSGKYKVTVGNGFGCAMSDSVTVVVRPPSGLELGPDKLLCNNEGIFLSAGVDANSYQWTSSNGFEATTKEIRPLLPGQYTVTIVDDYNCSAKDSIRVTPTTQSIVASYLLPSTVSIGDLVHFVLLTEPEPAFILWRFGDGGYSTEKNPARPYLRAGEFSPTLIVSNGVCSDTLTKSITVRNGRFEVQPEVFLPELIDIVEASAYPNPCKDFLNVSLSLTAASDVRITLYSMTGIMIYQKDDSFHQKDFQFDLTDKTDGIYFVKVMVAQRTRVLKVMKLGGNK